MGREKKMLNLHKEIMEYHRPINLEISSIGYTQMWVRKELKNYHFIHHMDPKIWWTVKHGSPKKI